METFCDDLRSERERRNISLETICAITKVSPSHLRALEAGDFGHLPGGVFRKGIVRGYLAAIGVDEHPWMQRFETALGAGDAVSSAGLAEFAENVSRTRPAPFSAQPARWLGVSSMALVVVLLGWCVWYFVLHGRVVLSSLLRS